MKTMTCAVSAYWDEDKGKWIVTATSDMTDYPYRRYEVAACDEFVAPIALMELHGFDALGCLNEDDGPWSIEDIT